MQPKSEKLMRKFILITFALFSFPSLWGQSILEELRENSQKAGSNYFAYPKPEKKP